MKKVLLIGDSIRMGYNDRVKALLADKAEVWGPADNCRFAKYTLWHLGSWMNEGANGKPAIIHWNNGIWDTFRISEDIDPFTPLDEYIRTMEQIYHEMKKTGAIILFANTTPVREGLWNDNNEKIDRYNEAITACMRARNVPVNDLNTLIKQDLNAYIGNDLLHLSEKGVEAASQQVAAFISRYL